MDSNRGDGGVQWDKFVYFYYTMHTVSYILLIGNVKICLKLSFTSLKETTTNMLSLNTTMYPFVNTYISLKIGKTPKHELYLLQLVDTDIACIIIVFR